MNSDKVLVIIQLNGGNDGLNTVIPIEDWKYFKARPRLAINKGLNLRPDLALHPSMTGMFDLYNRGQLAIVQGAGYDKPNYSHFRSTDIWMSASNSDQAVSTGWGGRLIDVVNTIEPVNYPAILRIGNSAPLIQQGISKDWGMVVNANNFNFYQLLNQKPEVYPNTRAGEELKYIKETVLSTTDFGTQIKTAAGKSTVQKDYPSNELALQLKLVSKLIAGGLPTKAYVVSLNGFDTHSGQLYHHSNLLKVLSESVAAFQADLEHLGLKDRVVSMTFSDFGRRIAENGSAGTDHGAASPMFVFGAGVKGGIVGENPIIPEVVTERDNLNFQYDYRCTYGTVLDKWFGVDSKTILNNTFETLPILN